MSRWRRGAAAIFGLLAALSQGACDREEVSALAPAALRAPSLAGEWYNAETTAYPQPAVATMRLTEAGGVVMTGIDGSAQYGSYARAPDGRLTIRLAQQAHSQLTVDDHAGAIEAARAQLTEYPVRVIFDAIPQHTKDRLELQTPTRLLSFTRDTAARQRVEAEIVAWSQAREAARKAEEERQKLLAETRRRENLRKVRSVASVRTVLPRFTGAGSGQRGCTRAVLSELRRFGWRVTSDAALADAILAVDLSRISHLDSFWVGRYYKMRYAVKLRRAGDGRVLAAFSGAERAAGDGAYETCVDTADEIADEIEDLIDDLRG